MNQATLNPMRGAAQSTTEVGQKSAVQALEGRASSVPGREPSGPATKEQVSAAVAHIDSVLKSSNRELQFQVDDESGKVIVRVRDSASGEVIRQMPNEEALRLARALQGNTQENASVLVDLTV